jgi:hypothetical protein
MKMNGLSMVFQKQPRMTRMAIRVIRGCFCSFWASNFEAEGAESAENFLLLNAFFCDLRDLLVAEGFYGVEARRFCSGINAEDQADRH